MFGFNQNNFISDVVIESDLATVAIDTTTGIVHRWDCTQDVTVNFSGDGLFTVLSITLTGILPKTITFGTNVHSTTSTFAMTAGRKHSLTFAYDGVEHILVGSQLTLL